MIASGLTIWLYLYLLIYACIVLYWARQAAGRNEAPLDFFNATGSLPPWMSALGIAGASISGWIVLGFPQTIATQGFGFGVLALAGIVIPLTGVLFFKRQWEIARRFNYTSQGKMLNGYYGGQSLGIYSAIISLVFVVGFSGLQLRAISQLLADLTQQPDNISLFLWGIASLLAGYVIIGGMRSVGYLSALQTVLMALAITCLGTFVLVEANGFTELNERLALLAADPSIASRSMFEVSGIIQFTSGLGVEEPAGHAWTAVMIASFAVSMLGIQASPMITQLVISTKNSNGFAAGQTWLFAGFFGLLIVFFITVIGASALNSSEPVLSSHLAILLNQSPWFAAAIVLGLVGAVQLVCALCLIAASNALVTDLYVPLYHKGLHQKDQVLFAKICVLLLLIVSCLLASVSPIALSAIGSLALPYALQLWPALIGLCWFKFISRQGVTTGLGVGLFAVAVTDTLGIAILEFLGLQLPWGRWPWTIHSGVWGLFFNVIAVVLISMGTRTRSQPDNAVRIRQYTRHLSAPFSKVRGLKSAAWSAVLAWSFLAVGPGLVFGNTVFGDPSLGMDAWVLGMPSLWAWSILFWAIGVFLIWFLAYKLNMATNSPIEVVPINSGATPEIRHKKIQEPELIRLMWTVTSVAALIAVTSWIFGS